MAIGEVRRDLDPLPAFAPDRVGLNGELLRHHAIDEGHILQPAAVVPLEQVAQHRAAGRLIGLDADEPDPLVGCPDRTLRQHATDGMGLLVVGLGETLQNLLLPLLVAGHGEVG
ncbi:hypothetical protein GGQ86_004859 [Xanthobacter flavus]|uniref:Uncharacterized protein n=1 Tax=Xanthobacter flavus TaxID=281 RepID=A0ABU1KP39_XANFL|nr:hypothetical protein [Xanthobacter flavus]